jgi:CBS domain-containing protein
VYEWIMGTDERAFPVMDGDRLLGMVCLEDIRKVPRQDWDRVTVAEIMTQSSQLDVVDTREDASQALERLTRHDVRQVPVLENGRLVGLLRRRDILKWLQVQSGLGLPEARL